MPARGMKKGRMTCWVCSQKYWLKDSGHRELCPNCVSEKSACVYCGVEMPKFSRGARKLRQYCSHRCHNLALNLASNCHKNRKPKKEKKPTQPRRKYNVCVVCGTEHDRQDPNNRLCPACYSETSICEQCGIEFRKRETIKGRPRRFCSTHCQGINISNRPEVIEKISKSISELWANDTEFVGKILVAVNSPELKERNSKRFKALWQNEEYQKEMSSVSRKTWSNPEFRAFMSQRISELRNGERKEEWDRAIQESWDEEKRNSLAVKLEQVWKDKFSDPDILEAYSRKMSERWDNPDFRERVSSGIRAFANGPEEKKRRSEQSLAMWRNPEIAERILMSAWKRLSEGKKTDIELIVEEKLKSIGIEAIYNHRVGNRFVDFAIIDKSIGIECDGEYWHRGREKEDTKRDEYLSGLGWTIIHLKGKEIKHDLANALSLKLLPLLP